MADSGAPPERRLDSWKAIADYLGRDVGTVRRWEKSLGLPLRRLPRGGRGHSVFAYASEIDVWLRSAQVPVTAVAPAARRRWIRWAAVAAILVIAVIAATAGTWRAVVTARPAPEDLRVHVTPDGVRAFDTSGKARWRYDFSGSAISYVSGVGDATRVLGGVDAGVLAGTAHRTRRSDNIAEGGELMWFDLTGELRRTFSFSDRVTLDGKTFEPPWALTWFAVHEDGGRRRIAVAAHHHIWHPSLVTILDERWQRRGTFAHAGWIENVEWLSPVQLLVGGFSQIRDAGMVAMLDADRLERDPSIVVAMPRTEVNRAAGSHFNRALVQRMPDRIVVRTMELPQQAAALAPAEVVYEFDSTLSLLRATHSGRYWDTHDALYLEGKLDHPQSRCPDRNGPRSIDVWQPLNGWKTIAARQP